MNAVAPSASAVFAVVRSRMLDTTIERISGWVRGVACRAPGHHPRHLNIRNNDPDLRALDALQTRRGGADGGDVEATAPEPFAEQEARVLVVFDKEDRVAHMPLRAAPLRRAPPHRFVQPVCKISVSRRYARNRSPSDRRDEVERARTAIATRDAITNVSQWHRRCTTPPGEPVDRSRKSNCRFRQPSGGYDRSRRRDLR